jgi:hypothetical protein
MYNLNDHAENMDENSEQKSEMDKTNIAENKLKIGFIFF